MNKSCLILTKLEKYDLNEDYKYYSAREWSFNQDENFDAVSSVDKININYLKNIELQILENYEYFIEKLSLRLNKIHQIKKEKKEWELVLGNWLRLFLELVFSRIHILERINLKNFSEVHVLSVSHSREFDFICNDRKSFAEFSENSLIWSQYILSHIVKYHKIKYENKFDIVFHDQIKNKYSFSQKDYSYKKMMKRFLFLLTKFIASFVSAKKRVIFSFPSLSFKNIFHISLKIKKIPIIYSQIERRENSSSINEKLRKTFFNIKKDDIYKNQKNFLAHLIERQLPSIYLENWGELNDELQKNRIPFTKLIIAGNGSDNDEIFRLFLSNHYKDIQYLIFQHGGVYGVSPIEYKGEFYEHRVAHKWISWGWKKKNFKNVISGFNLKNLNRQILFNKEKKVILIPLPYFSFTPTRILSSDINYTLEKLNKIISKLNDNIKSNIRLKPFPEVRNKNMISNLVDSKYISKEISLYSALKNSRIHISIINATTFLESLNLNFPTIIFFEHKSLIIRKNINSDFNKLKEVGIFYDNIDELVYFLNKNFYSIEKWWNNKKLQAVKNKFVLKYAKYDPNWLNQIKLIINNKL